MKLINYRAINSVINTVVASLFALCFISVCFSFALRFISVCSPLCFRYTSVMPSLCHRFVNGGRSSSQRRQIEFTTKNERMTNEARTRGRQKSKQGVRFKIPFSEGVKSRKDKNRAISRRRVKSLSSTPRRGRST